MVSSDIDGRAILQIANSKLCHLKRRIGVRRLGTEGKKTFYWDGESKTFFKPAVWVVHWVEACEIELMSFT